MAIALKLVSGIARTVSTAATIYDVTSQPGNISAGTPVTLPSSGNYQGEELKIFLNGQALDYGIDWNTSGAGPTYTAVTFTFDLLSAWYIRWMKVD